MQFTFTQWQTISFFSTLLQKGKYWECHEYLENLWIEEQEQQSKLFLGCLIHYATALYHQRNANKIGFQEQLQKSLEKYKKISYQKEALISRETWIEFGKYLNNHLFLLLKGEKEGLTQEILPFEFQWQL